MPLDFTDTDTFTDPIVGPADSDPADATYVRTIGQGLSNRTRNLRNAIVAYGQLLRLAASGSAAAQDIDTTPELLVGFDNEHDDGTRVSASFASGSITVNATGLYEVHASLSFGGTADTSFTLRLFKDGVGENLRAEVRSDSDAGSNNLGMSGLVELDAGEELQLYIAAGAAAQIILRAGSTFWLRRVA